MRSGGIFLRSDSKTATALQYKLVISNLRNEMLTSAARAQALFMVCTCASLTEYKRAFIIVIIINTEAGIANVTMPDAKFIVLADSGKMFLGPRILRPTRSVIIFRNVALLPFSEVAALRFPTSCRIPHTLRIWHIAITIRFKVLQTFRISSKTDLSRGSTIPVHQRALT